MQIWNENWMWWNLPAMNYFQFIVMHKWNDLFFTLLFRWISCLILTIPNIFNAFCIKDLANSNKPTRFSSLFNLVITQARWTPHLTLECLIEWATWKKPLLPMWASMFILFIIHHFTSYPTCRWHGSLFE